MAQSREPEKISRRDIMLMSGACGSTAFMPNSLFAEDADSRLSSLKDLRIAELRVTPIAIPEPPLLASGGCHGPYFLRNVVEVQTDDGIVGIGETHGSQLTTEALRQSRPMVQGRSAFQFRSFSANVRKLSNACYAGIELACLDAIGKATKRRLCELLGGPVRDRVEFAAYLFFRYAADHPAVFADPRLVDQRGRGDQALDKWGEVRSPDSMAEMAASFHQQWGFRVFKLKAGVLPPDVELDSLRAMNNKFAGKYPLRIDPNANWSMETALRIGRELQSLPLEYYEDPVEGQPPMAQVRQATGLKMSTNMCVTRFEHIPAAIMNSPIDVVLGDHHGWGGITAFQTLGLMTESLGWGLSQHSNSHAGITMAAMIHAAASTPQLNYASDTHYVWIPNGEDIIQGSKLPIVDGFMRVPSGPGLGVELDRDKLARAHERFDKCGMRSRNDAETMHRFQPGWQRRLF